MIPLLQQFEFGYPDGDLFYDRSGALIRKLQPLFPGLAGKEALINQREFHIPGQQFNGLFGIAFSRLQSFEPGEKEFDQKAAAFLQNVCQIFELEILSQFSFRHVIGKACSSQEEAQELMWPLVGEEQRAKMRAVSPLSSWTSLQGEFTANNLAFESKLAVMNLRSATAEPDSALIPHITFHLQATGVSPIAPADFDAASFVRNMRDSHSKEILEKLAPHLV